MLRNYPERLPGGAAIKGGPTQREKISLGQVSPIVGHKTCILCCGSVCDAGRHTCFWTWFVPVAQSILKARGPSNWAGAKGVASRKHEGDDNDDSRQQQRPGTRWPDNVLGSVQDGRLGRRGLQELLRQAEWSYEAVGVQVLP